MQLSLMTQQVQVDQEVVIYSLSKDKPQPEQYLLNDVSHLFIRIVSFQSVVVCHSEHLGLILPVGPLCGVVC